MSINRNFATRSAFVLASKLLKGGAALLFVLVITRHYGAGEAGLYFLALTIVMMSSQVALLGLPQACLKFIPMIKAQGDLGTVREFMATTRWIVALVATTFVATLVVLAHWLSHRVFDEAALAPVIAGIAPVLLFWPLIRISMRARQATHDMTGIVYYENVFLPVGTLAAAAAAAALGLPIATVALLISVVYGLALISISWTNPGELGAFGGVGAILPGRAGMPLRQIVVYALPLMGVGFIQYAVFWSDTLMLGYFADTTEVGIYNAAIRISLASTLLLYVVNTIFAPAISEFAARKDYAGLANRYDRCVEYLLAISLPVIVVVVFFARELMDWFGAGFAAGAMSLMILMVGQMFNIAVGPVGYMLLLSGRERVEVLNILATFVVNVILNLVLIPRYGMLGAAVATTISMGGSNMLRLYQNKRYYGVRWLNGSNARIIAGVFGAVLVTGWVASMSSQLVFLLVPLVFAVVLRVSYPAFFHRALSDLALLRG